MRGENGTRGGGQGDGDDLELVVSPAEDARGHEAGRRRQGNRRRALCQAQSHRDDVGGDDDGDADVVEHVLEGVADAGGTEHSAEHSARAGDEDDRGDGRKSRVEEFFQSRSVHSLGRSKHGDRCEDGDEQCDAGLSEQAENLCPQRQADVGKLGVGAVLAERSRLRHEIDGRVEEDEEHRQEEDAHDGGDPRRIFNGFGPRAEDRLGDVDVREFFGAAAPPQHAGDVEGGDRENDADHHEVAEVDAVEGGCGDRAGVRRHEDVHHGEGDGRGEGVEQDGPAQPLGDGEDDGQHDHEAGVEEHGEAQQKGGEAQRHGGALLTEFSDHVVGEHLGAAGMFDQHAQHCAEAHQYSDAAQR